MSEIVDGVQEAIEDLRGFQAENQQAEKWHMEGLQAGQEAVEGLDEAGKASERFAAKAAEVECQTGDIMSSIDELITQVTDTLGKIAVVETSVKESTELQGGIEEGLEKASDRYGVFTDGLDQAFVAADGIREKAESAWGRLVTVGMEYSTQEGGAGTSMLRETQALSDLTVAYTDELKHASRGLNGDVVVHLIDSTKDTLGGVTLGVVDRADKTVSISGIKRTLESALSRLQQGKEDLLSIQAKTLEDREEITRGQGDIKAIREKTDIGVSALDTQKEAPATGAQVAASAIKNGERYITRLSKC